MADEPPVRPAPGDRAELPARDFLDIHLADVLRGPGCPLCARRLEAGHRYLGTLLYEGVNDVGLRRQLDESRGLCPRHTAQMLEVDRAELGGVLGASILLDATLRRRLVEVEALRGAKGRSLDRGLAIAGSPAGCPACHSEAESASAGAERLVDRLPDPAWADALAAAELCLADLLDLWRVASRKDDSRRAWAPVAERQVERLRALADDLAAFAHHSTHDRRHRMTAAQEHAAGVATRVIAGLPAQARSKRRSPRPAGG